MHSAILAKQMNTWPCGAAFMLHIPAAFMPAYGDPTLILMMAGEASLELDLCAGYAASVENFNYDLGLIYYAYLGADSSLDYDFVEVVGSIDYDFDTLSTSASLYYSPEYFGDSGDAHYWSADAEMPLPYDLTASGHIECQYVDDNATFGFEDYTDWSIGLGYTFEVFDLSLQYVDTDLSEPGECADGCEERFNVGTSRSF